MYKGRIGKMFAGKKRFLFSAAILAAAVGSAAVGGALCNGAQTVRAENTEQPSDQIVYTEGDNRFTFTYAEESWTLTSYEGSAKNLTLPSPDKIPVQAGQSALVSYAVGADVFTGAAALRTAVLPAGVTAIGERAFADTKLTALTLPETVTAIGAEAFRGCWVLGSVVFEEGESELTLAENCFNDCISLTNVELPARCASVASGAFGGCEALEWAYVNSSALAGTKNVFSEAEGLTVVFSEKADYERAVSENAVAGARTSYLVDVIFRIEGQAPRTEQRLYGRGFACERIDDDGSKDYNGWAENASITDLPAQHESYASTAWYSDGQYREKVTLSSLDLLLKSAEKPETIELYAHKTVLPPEVKRTVSHGYEKQGFELADGEGMCALLGIDSYADRGALRFSAIAEGGAGALTKIVNTGTYLVSVTLGEEYGVWKNTGIATLTITGGAARTTQIMLIMLSVAGLAAVVLTIALVLVRSRTGYKKRREISSEEAIDKFIASGGRTRLKK